MKETVKVERHYPAPPRAPKVVAIHADMTCVYLTLDEAKTVFSQLGEVLQKIEEVVYIA